MTWDKQFALDIVARLEELADDLRGAARGSDSALVLTKISTLETSLKLLRAYLDEADAP